MKIRVLRLLEYTYDSVETMHGDMQKWAVQGTHVVGVHADKPTMTIKSTTLPMDLLEELADKVELVKHVFCPVTSGAVGCGWVIDGRVCALPEGVHIQPPKVKESVPVGLYVDKASRTVLLQQRTRHEEFKDTWELPGGKILLGETCEQALAREWKEELNVDVIVGDFLGTAEFPTVFLHLFRIDSISPTNPSGGQEPIDWFGPAGLEQLPLAPGLIKFLPIVRRYL